MAVGESKIDIPAANSERTDERAAGGEEEVRRSGSGSGRKLLDTRNDNNDHPDPEKSGGRGSVPPKDSSSATTTESFVNAIDIFKLRVSDKQHVLAKKEREREEHEDQLLHSDNLSLLGRYKVRCLKLHYSHRCAERWYSKINRFLTYSPIFMAALSTVLAGIEVVVAGSAETVTARGNDTAIVGSTSAFGEDSYLSLAIMVNGALMVLLTTVAASARMDARVNSHSRSAGQFMDAHDEIEAFLHKGSSDAAEADFFCNAQREKIAIYKSIARTLHPDFIETGRRLYRTNVRESLEDSRM